MERQRKNEREPRNNGQDGPVDDQLKINPLRMVAANYTQRILNGGG